MINPFDPLQITSAIITNIATDMLVHIIGAERFNNTLVARFLKRRGVVQLTFQDNFENILKQAITLFFEENKQYCIYGVETFLKHPNTGTQIGNYILDRTEPNRAEIEVALDDSLHSVAKYLAEKKNRSLNASDILNAFFDSFKKILILDPSLPGVAVLLEVDSLRHDLTQTIESEAIKTRALIEQKLTSETINSTPKQEKTEFVAHVRWLHLADLPLDVQYYQFILKQVQDKVNNNTLPQFIFITGDITQSGNRNEFETFHEQLVLPLLDLLGQDTIFIVPGDLDLDKSIMSLMDFHRLPLRFPNFFDQTEEGHNLRQEIMGRFQNYIETDITDISGDWIASKRGIFTHETTINKYTIGIMGINTALLSVPGKDQYQLSIGKKTISDGLTSLRNSRIRFVLGHHPIDWLMPEEYSTIQTLFNDYNVIYLHGHFHNNPKNFFTANLGNVTFIAGTDTQQTNYAIWGEVDFNLDEIQFTPFLWSPQNTQVFPTEQIALKIGDSPSHPPPLINHEGWHHITKDYLDQRRKVLSPEDALTYFDGTLLEWRHALTPQIPRRNIVQDLINSISEHQIVILLAPGGEGKSTSLYQTVCDIVYQYPDWHVLWQQDIDAKFDRSLMTWLTGQGQKETYVIVVDDVAPRAKHIFQTLKRTPSSQRSNIKLLLASRDTDWINEDTNQLSWDNLGAVILNIPRLNTKEALNIIKAWRPYGKEGLGKLIKYETDEQATEALLDETQLEHYEKEGAFLGALLRVRGDSLRHRVQRLLTKLEKRTILGGYTLLDIYAYIAIPHAHGLFGLTKPILSSILNLNETNNKQLNNILKSFGKEVISKGRILIRHRTIAEVAVELLPMIYGVESIEYDKMSELLFHISAVRGAGIRIPRIAEWNYYSKKVFDMGKAFEEYGIQIAEATVKGTPPDGHTNVDATLAALYRRANDLENALHVLRNIPVERKKHRAYYAEWALCELQSEHWWESIYLSGLAVCDQVQFDTIDHDRVNLFGRVCERAFSELSKYNSNFEQFSILASNIRKQNYTPSSIERNKLYDLLGSFRNIYENLSHDLPNWLLSIDELSFKKFDDYLFNKYLTPKR